ncbi:MAG: hypothetical protein KAJ07_12260 [Planctomycetes bacterium]|nr:hypothetical protein [Planctomycetota bacterium]
MRKKRPKRNTAIRESHLANEKNKWDILVALMWVVLLASIGLKIFKADVSGMTYDESLTLTRYCDSVETAVTNFDRKSASSTNNHLLNSILIHYARKFFSSYEHYIRIPSLAAGVLFSLSMFYIVRKSVSSRLICLTGLGTVLLTPFVFDYSLLARGYSLALGGLYAGIAFIIYLLGHKIRYRYWFLPALVMIGINFLCLGSMISSLIILVCLNAVFVLFYCYKIVEGSEYRLRLIIYNGVTILAGTAGSVFYLYRHIYLDVINSRSLAKISGLWRGWNSLGEYFNDLVLRGVFKIHRNIGMILFCVFSALVLCSIGYFVFIAIRKFSRDGFKRLVKSDSRASFMMVFSSTCIVTMIVYCGVFKRSPGLLRSQVFFVPMLLVWSMVLLDRFVCRIKPAKVKILSAVLVSVLFATITIRNIPSARRTNSSSMSGPVLRKLKKIDAAYPWSITFSRRHKLSYMGFLYYRQFGYKFRMAPGGTSVKGPGASDIFICAHSRSPKGSVCLDENYFKEFGCAMLVHPGLAESGKIDKSRLSVIE